MRERYEIRIRGLIGPLLRRVFGDLRVETLPAQSTIRGRMSPAELDHLLLRLQESGVELVFLEGKGS
ncbi:hypothetical protein BJ973_002222 [Actinoplanes tereljensis]|uniref:Uncharacterized protein n=1 Tax=Paractinoplanes tereljensis TaxID=571912 RepID=A0A919NN64_9ACTN|nr:hypothetical protein [Actinoplanes tereljensis]GIF21895.1 hypothetical protein Ate02nite_46250 [Actinoplanes tereljensis]